LEFVYAVYLLIGLLLAAAVCLAARRYSIGQPAAIGSAFPINDAFFMLNGQGRIIWANDRAEALYGSAGSSFKGKSFLDLRAPDCTPRFKSSDEEAGGLIYEILHHRSDGTTFPVEVSLRTTRQDDHDLTLAIVRDMSQSKAYEEKEQSEALVFEQTRDGVVITDAETRIIAVNAAFTKITGYEEAEVLGQDPRILSSGRHDNKFYTELWDVISDKGYWQGEIWNRRRDGSIICVWQTISAVYNDDGSVRNYFSVFTDITERKAQDEKLRFHSQILDMIGEAVIATDVDGRITYWNDRAEEMYGWKEEEVLGRNIVEVTPSMATQDLAQDIMGDLLNGATKWSGEFEVQRRDGTSFNALVTTSQISDEDGNLVGMIGVSMDISDRKEAEERLFYLAQYDSLTDLPNRNLFMDRLEQAILRARRHNNSMALMFLDLDRFKEINDTLGHLAGDMLLCKVAERLTSNLRDVDTIARLGGDEFIILLEQVRDQREIEMVVNKILDFFAAPFSINENDVFVPPSIGITVYPDDADNARELLKAADIAMYEAKRNGGNCYEFYSTEKHAKSTLRLSMESNLRQAIDQDELSLAYQCRVSARDGETIGLEALLRWHNASLGTVPPIQFIPIAEETGLIIGIGEWILRQVCRQWVVWRDAGRLFTVSVNISARQFRQRDFTERLAAIIGETGMDPAWLELEITETMIMTHAEDVIRTLSALHDLGIKLTIDDFGTGYSSLAYLKRFPVDALKIDQSFVRDVTSDPDDEAIVRAIISMARNLNLSIVAEGIETKEQMEFLKSAGCDEFQGFYFCHPCSPDQI